jgi:hypothetical protein
MKTVSTKLDRETFEKFQEMCNQDGQSMAEQLRELIKRNIDVYGLKSDKEEIVQSRPEMKVTRISYDGKTWYDVG